MRADRRILGLLCACVFGGLAACSEPEENITGSTADGLFALRMEAEKNWVHAEDVLPIRVTLESQTGAFLTERTERVEFLVNNGSVSPSSLTFSSRSAHRVPPFRPRLRERTDGGYWPPYDTGRVHVANPPTPIHSRQVRLRQDNLVVDSPRSLLRLLDEQGRSSAHEIPPDEMLNLVHTMSSQ